MLMQLNDSQSAKNAPRIGKSEPQDDILGNDSDLEDVPGPDADATSDLSVCK